MPSLPTWLSAATQGAWLSLRGLARGLLGRERLDRLLDASGLRALKSRWWRFERVMPDGNRLVYRAHDQCIIDEIYAEKAYAGGAEISPGQTVVDAGGHIGVFALYAARRVGPGGRVVVCEPSPDNLELLKRNLALNGCTQISLCECALAEKEGRAELFIPGAAADNPAANTLFATPGRASVSVPLRTLDSIAAEEGLCRVDHLKIDVEGAELRVLQGAEKTLALTRRIVMELHPGRVEPEDVLAHLSARGFRCRTLSESPLIVEALREG